MKCRDCKLYDLEATKDKAGRVRRDRVARCLWESKEQWPLSVNLSLNSRPSPSYMLPDGGHGCQCFQWKK